MKAFIRVKCSICHSHTEPCSQCCCSTWSKI